MGKTQFQINLLNNPTRTFLPGQTIVGRVTLVKDKECEHKEGSKQILPPGQHSFSFEFTLPQSLPSSFVGHDGSVYYDIKTVMICPWKFKNYKARLPFTVNEIVDLNLVLGADQPVEVRKFKTLGFLCCKPGPAGFVLNMKRKGFASGEYVQFVAEFDNQSNQKVTGVKASLVQFATFIATSKTNTSRKIICSAIGPVVQRGETEIWQGNILKIPNLPPTNTSGIIHVEYELWIKMVFDGLSKSLKESFPIIIGSIPLRDAFQPEFCWQGPEGVRQDVRVFAVDPDNEENQNEGFVMEESESRVDPNFKCTTVGSSKIRF